MVEIYFRFKDFFKKYLYISWSFSRYILSRHGKLLGLDSKRIPANNAVNQYAEALAKAWSEYNNPRSVQTKKISWTFTAAFGSLLYFLDLVTHLDDLNYCIIFWLFSWFWLILLLLGNQIKK